MGIAQNINFIQKIRNIFNAQKQQQYSVKQTAAEGRIEKLTRFREVVINYKEEVAKALYYDFQKQLSRMVA